MHDQQTIKEFEKWGKLPPTSSRHGTEDDIHNNMKRLMPHSWKLSGNELMGMTEFGELRQTIPTDYILSGIDDIGRPVFEKIKL